jgi:hypothetical protein
MASDLRPKKTKTNQNMRSNSKSTKKWFWAWLILMTVAKSQLQKKSAQTEVWKNLVIIQAKDADEAFEKACKIGRSESGDCRGSLRLANKPAIAKFLGVADMGLIYDELADGAEILWRLRRCSQKTARSFVTSKADLLSQLQAHHSAV